MGGHGEENEVPPQRRRRRTYERHFRWGRRHSAARAADEMGGRGGKEGIRHLRGGHFSDVRGVGGAVVLARRAVPDGGAAVSPRRLRGWTGRREAVQKGAEPLAAAHFRALSALWRLALSFHGRLSDDGLASARARGLRHGHPLSVGRRWRDAAAPAHDALSRRRPDAGAGHQPPLLPADGGNVAP